MKKDNKNIEKNNNEIISAIVISIIAVVVFCIIFYFLIKSTKLKSYTLETIPEYSGESFVYLYENKPNFSEKDYGTSTFESYSELDSLGRTGVAYANISKELMPTEERTPNTTINPSGWKQATYNIVSGGYLYNRCHLIGYQLTAENDNEKNLITCTRQMNISGMLKWENKVANYINDNNKNVLYRVTPIYDNNNLLVSGVQIEASSVEDKCGKICFNIYVYNVQDGITIDYATGDSSLAK